MPGLACIKGRRGRGKNKTQTQAGKPEDKKETGFSPSGFRAAAENQERADRLHWPDLSCSPSWSERGGRREGEGKQKEELMMRKQDFRDDYRGESSPYSRM